jgi:catechol 2,3-dioxygenase-like lactoylglutathione lyase family enzyme
MIKSRIAPALSLFALLTLVACSAGSAAPTASPSVPPLPSVAPSTPEPIISPPPSAAPPATPAPVVTPPPATPRPTNHPLTDVERNFLAGVQRGAENCLGVGGADLPDGAVIGIECDGTEPGVARLGFYQFENDQGMIDAYTARMDAEGLELESGTSCSDGAAEHAYIPGEGEILARAGCFLNDEGYANYRYTIPGDHVYVGILGDSADMGVLETFAWVGNQDTPGVPTLWFGGID